MAESLNRDLTFELIYTDTNIVVERDSMGSFYASIINTSQNNIYVATIRSESIMTSGWSNSICLGELCFNESIDSAAVYIGVGDTISLGVLAWTSGIGEGTIKLNIFNLEFPDENVTLELHFETEQLNIVNNKYQSPKIFKIGRSFPNPFNPNITIEYELKADSKISVIIYNKMGKLVKVLASGYEQKGHKTIRWNATNESNMVVPAGLYLYIFRAGDYSATKKIMFLK